MRYRLRLLSNSGHKLGTREFETDTRFAGRKRSRECRPAMVEKLTRRLGAAGRVRCRTLRSDTVGLTCLQLIRDERCRPSLDSACSRQREEYPFRIRTCPLITTRYWTQAIRPFFDQMHIRNDPAASAHASGSRVLLVCSESGC